MKAVIDRFENEYAVVLFGAEEIKVDIPKKLLPAGSKEGSCLKAIFELDLEKNQKQEEKIRLKIEKLKQNKRKID